MNKIKWSKHQNPNSWEVECPLKPICKVTIAEYKMLVEEVERINSLPKSVLSDRDYVFLELFHSTNWRIEEGSNIGKGLPPADNSQT